MGFTISHDTDMIDSWTKTMDSNDTEYEELVKKFYAVLEDLLGSVDLQGGLADDLSRTAEEVKNPLLSYSQTFKDCSEFMKKTGRQIESDEQYLNSVINNNNPLE